MAKISSTACSKKVILRHKVSVYRTLGPKVIPAIFKEKEKKKDKKGKKKAAAYLSECVKDADQ